MWCLGGNSGGDVEWPTIVVTYKYNAVPSSDLHWHRNYELKTVLYRGIQCGALEWPTVVQRSKSDHDNDWSFTNWAALHPTYTQAIGKFSRQVCLYQP